MEGQAGAPRDGGRGTERQEQEAREEPLRRELERCGVHPWPPNHLIPAAASGQAPAGPQPPRAAPPGSAGHRLRLRKQEGPAVRGLGPAQAGGSGTCGSPGSVQRGGSRGKFPLLRKGSESGVCPGRDLGWTEAPGGEAWLAGPGPLTSGSQLPLALGIASTGTHGPLPAPPWASRPRAPPGPPPLDLTLTRTPVGGGASTHSSLFSPPFLPLP